jgi:two-component system response regulator
VSPVDTPLNVLVVEDDAGDVLLIEEAFAASPLHTSLTVVGDGALALEHLRDEARPDMVLLDLNLPKVRGTEVLAFLKVDPELRTIPVVVFTTSSSAEDIAECYRSYANAYVTKPTDFDEFLAVVNSIDHFFTETAALARP